MLPVVDTVIELLTREAVKVDDLNAALGEVMDGGTQNVPFKLRPRDPALREAIVVRANGSNEVSHVELVLVQPLPMQVLVNAFGAPYHVPLVTSINAGPRVAFYVELQGRTHTAAIFASYSRTRRMS